MINKVILVGRLCADPELRQTTNGISVASFRVACNRPYTGKSGERQADFINVVAWRQQAELVSKYFAKGNAIGIEGSIQSRDYTDKEGNKRVAVEVVADSISFIESKSGGTGGAKPQSFENSRQTESPAAFATGDVSDFAEIDDDDLPF